MWNFKRVFSSFTQASVQFLYSRLVCISVWGALCVFVVYMYFISAVGPVMVSVEPEADTQLTYSMWCHFLSLTPAAVNQTSPVQYTCSTKTQVLFSTYTVVHLNKSKWHFLCSWRGSSYYKSKTLNSIQTFNKCRVNRATDRQTRENRSAQELNCEKRAKGERDMKWERQSEEYSSMASLELWLLDLFMYGGERGEHMVY